MPPPSKASSAPCAPWRSSAVLRAALFALVAALVAGNAAAASKPGKHAQRPWGAIAFSSSTGQFGYAVDYTTRRAAESEAFRLCGPQCDVIRSFRDTCAALASRGGTHAWDTGSSREIAEMKAGRKCAAGRGGAAGRDACRISVWACTTAR